MLKYINQIGVYKLLIFFVLELFHRDARNVEKL